jgi:type I restriction enzyme S subunit
LTNIGWPLVPLGELLARNEDLISLAPDKQYREVKIRLWGKGVVLRQIVAGADIAADRRYQVAPGQFIVSRIDARNGAMGIVPDELDEAVVTNDFPSFNINHGRLIPSFLGWLCRTPGFVEMCRAASEGTTNRVRLKEDRFMQQAIPLPQLEEQRRIVARIDRLAAKIDEAQLLRRHSNDECDQLCRAILRDERFGAPNPTPMRELVTWRKPHVDVVATDSYEFAGVYCFGRGVFRGQRRTGSEFAYRQLTQIRSGEFIYPKLMAWEGALAVVPAECDGLYVSPEFPVFTIHDDKVLPEVLDVYFRSPAVWPLLSGASTGTNVRRKRLNPSDFLNYSFPLPSREGQIALRNIRRKVTDLQSLSNQSSQLNALLPSILDRAFKGAL